jgi:UDP-N-acetylmuramoyl-L-alanyl-D-glutamate--2,6-diaminopimelate ligase
VISEPGVRLRLEGAVKLVDLLRGLPIREGRNVDVVENADVTDLFDDSRKVEPGGLFVAAVGKREDGHRFIEEALRRGAVAVVSERPPENGRSSGACWIEVEDSRKALLFLAQRFFHHPADGLRLVGVTGTNGKTTTSFLGKKILEEGGRKKVGILGTVCYDVGEGPEVGSNTTPGILALQRLFRRMRNHGVDRAVMEVSSHAMDQDRVSGCRFTTAVFTNLTQDHLDYHETMEDYFGAKRKLFEAYLEGAAVVNVDDPYGQQLADLLKGGARRVLTFGMERKADLSPASLRVDRRGISMRLATDAGPLDLSSRLMGRYNAYNLLAGVGIGLSEGVPPEAIAEGIEKMRAIPGRFELIEAGQDFQVVVDYAHSEDALNRLLEAAAALKPKRLLTLFGCGGDRDRGKRPRMGRVAARWSDLVVLTSDNPRTEEPREIIREIEEGVSALSRETGKTYPYEVRVDRFEAIKRILSLARSGDLVVIAGKGHEREQTIGNRRIPFDDRQVAGEILKSIVKR